MAETEECRPFLLPCTDKFALFVSEHRDELEVSFTFVLPPRELFGAFLCKTDTYDLAARGGPPAVREAGTTTNRRTREPLPGSAQVQPRMSGADRPYPPAGGVIRTTSAPSARS